MALIGKIREKSWILLVFVGLALLTFIVNDYFTTNRNEDFGIGSIDGKKVDPNLFETLKYYAETNAQQQAQQQGKQITEREKEQAAETAWDQTVEATMLQNEFIELGVEVKESEWLDMYTGRNGFPLSPQIASQFSDSTGRLDTKKLEDALRSNEKPQPEEKPEDSQARIQQWIMQKNQMMMNRRTEKYYQLIGVGSYVTQLEAAEEYKAKKETKTITYVSAMFASIPDTDVKPKESDIKAFYDAHKTEKKYESKAGRDVKYFDLQVAPSLTDSAEFNQFGDSIRKMFATTTLTDSAFVMQYSAVKNYSSKNNVYKSEALAQGQPGNTYPAYLDTVIKTARVGQILDTYQSGENTCIAKFLGFITPEAKVRHILISAKREDAAESAKAKIQADSILKVLTKANFEALCAKYSGDTGSKTTGGVIDWFLDNGQMVPEFAKYAFSEPVGKFGIVQSQFGFHIMEVTGKRFQAPSLAVVQRKLIASNTTLSDASSLATETLYAFRDKLDKISNPYKRVEMFDTLALKQKFFSRPIKINNESPRAYGFTSPMSEDKILNFAYSENAEIGQLIEAPFKDDKRYIIAIIASIREDGIPTYEDSREIMKNGAIKKIKADRLMARMLKHKTLEAIAKEFNTMPTKAEVNFANPTLGQSGGMEPQIVGSLFGAIKDGQRTKPQVGENGIYIILVEKTNKASIPADYKEEVTALTSQLKGSLNQGVKAAMKKMKNVKDNRRVRF